MNEDRRDSHCGRKTHRSHKLGPSADLYPYRVHKAVDDQQHQRQHTHHPEFAGKLNQVAVGVPILTDDGVIAVLRKARVPGAKTGAEPCMVLDPLQAEPVHDKPLFGFDARLLNASLQFVDAKKSAHQKDVDDQQAGKQNDDASARSSEQEQPQPTCNRHGRKEGRIPHSGLGQDQPNDHQCEADAHPCFLTQEGVDPASQLLAPGTLLIGLEVGHQQSKSQRECHLKVPGQMISVHKSTCRDALVGLLGLIPDIVGTGRGHERPVNGLKCP